MSGEDEARNLAYAISGPSGFCDRASSQSIEFINFIAVCLLLNILFEHLISSKHTQAPFVFREIPTRDSLRSSLPGFTHLPEAVYAAYNKHIHNIAESRTEETKARWISQTYCTSPTAWTGLGTSILLRLARRPSTARQTVQKS